MKEWNGKYKKEKEREWNQSGEGRREEGKGGTERERTDAGKAVRAQGGSYFPRGIELFVYQQTIHLALFLIHDLRVTPTPALPQHKIHK